MSAARTSISMPESIMEDAIARQHELRLASFSDYIQELIRNDLLAHPIELKDRPATTAPQPGRPVNYKARRKRKLPPEQRS